MQTETITHDTMTNTIDGAMCLLVSDQRALSAAVEAMHSGVHRDMQMIDQLAARRDNSAEFVRGMLAVEAPRLGLGEHRVGAATVKVKRCDISNGQMAVFAVASLDGEAVGLTVWAGPWRLLPAWGGPVAS